MKQVLEARQEERRRGAGNGPAGKVTLILPYGTKMPTQDFVCRLREVLPLIGFEEILATGPSRPAWERGGGRRRRPAAL